MKNSMGFTFFERDVRSSSTAYQSIFSKQDILRELATGKLPFDTRVSNPNVQKSKTEYSSTETKSKKDKIDETKDEKAMIIESKIEKTKIEKAKIEKAKIEKTKIDETKDEKAKIEETKGKEPTAVKDQVEKTKIDKTKIESKIEKETVHETIPIVTIESKTTGCTYKMMRGERKGESCNKPCSKDSMFCKIHK